ALLDFKDAEVAQLNAALANERVHYGVEGLLHDFLGLELGKTDVFGDLLDDFFLGHRTFAANSPWLGSEGQRVLLQVRYKGTHGFRLEFLHAAKSHAGPESRWGRQRLRMLQV